MAVSARREDHTPGDWLLGRGIFTPWNRGRTLPPEPLSADEITALFCLCSKRGFLGHRNRALLAVLYRGGLRCAEATALELRDVDLEQGSLRVRHGKGDHCRVVGLDPIAVNILRSWLQKRPDHGSDLLFPTWTGERMQTSHVRRLLKTLARKAGIKKRVHPHGLRHTHAAELAAEGIPVNLIQKQLGHANLAVTSRYLDHIAPTQLIETMKARTWR